MAGGGGVCYLKYFSCSAPGDGPHFTHQAFGKGPLLAHISGGPSEAGVCFFRLPAKGRSDARSWSSLQPVPIVKWVASRKV